MFSKELLQKGVPTNLPLPVELNVTDLINICKNTKNLKSQIEIAGESFYDLICNICDKKTAEFFKLKKLNNLEVFINEETLEKKLIVSASNIFNMIADLTGKYSIRYYDFNAINNIIEKLKAINEDELKKEYPNLYNYYLNERQQVIALVPMKENFKKMNYSNIVARIKMLSDLYECEYEIMKDKIDNATANYNYKIFLDEFIYILNNLNKLSQLLITPSLQKDNTVYSDINIEINDEDSEKLGIYITYVYQEMLKKMKKEYQQEYLYYLSEYYFENKDLIEQNKKLYSSYFDKIIKLKDMYDDYKQILVNNPKLRIVDFNYNDFIGMNLSEVNEFMCEYFKSLNANWEFFKDARIDENTISKIIKYYGDSTKFSNHEELKKFLNKFIEKKEFFDRTDPYYRILGKNSFDGYIGYIYSNGTVVLEKFFENSATGKVAQNQAIYIMSIQNFHTLTQLSKNEIISQKLCKRFIHKGNWQEKIIVEINKDNDNNPVNQIDKFIEEGIIKIH